MGFVAVIVMCIPAAGAAPTLHAAVGNHGGHGAHLHDQHGNLQHADHLHHDQLNGLDIVVQAESLVAASVTLGGPANVPGATHVPPGQRNTPPAHGHRSTPPGQRPSGPAQRPKPAPHPPGQHAKSKSPAAKPATTTAQAGTANGGAASGATTQHTAQPTPTIRAHAPRLPSMPNSAPQPTLSRSSAVPVTPGPRVIAEPVEASHLGTVPSVVLIVIVAAFAIGVLGVVAAAGYRGRHSR